MATYFSILAQKIPCTEDLVVYSPQNHRNVNTTEHMNTTEHTHTNTYIHTPHICVFIHIYPHTRVSVCVCVCVQLSTNKRKILNLRNSIFKLKLNILITLLTGQILHYPPLNNHIQSTTSNQREELHSTMRKRIKSTKAGTQRIKLSLLQDDTIAYLKI